MPFNRLALSLAILMIATPGCILDRSGRAYNCEGHLMDDAALHTDGAIPGWCLDRLLDGSLADAEVLPDAGPEDGGDAGDAEVPDAGPVDAGVDAGTDAGSDAGPEDGGPPDSGPPDAGPPDAGPRDGGPADAGSDAGPPPVGCADGTVDQPYIGHPDMVGCDGAVNQCTAATLCGVGWHLCPPGEYEARGGDSTPASTIRWLAGCLRMGNCSSTGGVTAAICGDCSVESGPLAIVGGACSGGGRLESNSCPIGATASSMGIRYRLDGDPDCVHAEVAGTDVPLGATCCL